LNQNQAQLVIKALDRDRDEILAFSRELIALDTENPPGRNYKSCAEFISNQLDRLGLAHEVIEVPTPAGDDRARDYPRFCLLSPPGQGQRTLYFHGHYDVVPACSPDQFKPRIESGRLIGRGSADMKSGLAAMIYAARAIQESGIKLDGRVALSIVPDEETGGRLGSQYLARAGLLGRDGIGMLMPEPTSGAVWNANRGAVSLNVRVKGKPAHVGLQHQGVNAFERGIEAAQALLVLKEEVEARRTGFNLKPDEAKASILMLGGLCRGGSGFNLVPEEFSFTLDRRINPEEDLAEEKARLFDLLESLRRKGLDLEIETLQEGSSSGVSEDNPLARALARNVEAVTGRRPAFEMCPGLLEIRFYLDRGVPALAYGPGLLESAHGPEEFVAVREIQDCAAIYALTALDLLAA